MNQRHSASTRLRGVDSTPTAFGESRPEGGVCVLRHISCSLARSPPGDCLVASFSTMSTTDTDIHRIRVSSETRNALWERKRGPGDSYDDVLRRELGLEYPRE